MSVTLRDVARTAGVSVKTVSRVVNNQGEISEETRQRIKSVVREMGYRPNLVARGLVTQRTRTIGLIVPDITNPFFPEIAKGVQDACRLQDYNVYLCNSGESQQEELRALNSLAAQGVDGIIISPCYLANDSLSAFAEQFRPLVTINHDFEHHNIGRVMTDNFHGAQLAIRYLLDKGHRKIGMIAGVEQSPLRGRRLGGYCNVMQAHNLELAIEHVKTLQPNIESGMLAAQALLSAHPDLTAIFAYNDMVALGILQACRQSGRQLPQDCAIIGFDDIQVAALSSPALTTIRLDKHKIGEVAVQQMFEMINSPQKAVEAVQLAVELVVRQSA